MDFVNVGNFGISKLIMIII